jgi:uncharacterized caspase-like protein
MIASAPGQFVVQDISLSHSLFTNYLIEGLSGAANPVGSRGLITADALFNFIRYRVSELSNGQTVPIITQSAATTNPPLAVFDRLVPRLSRISSV